MCEIAWWVLPPLPSTALPHLAKILRILYRSSDSFTVWIFFLPCVPDGACTSLKTVHYAHVRWEVFHSPSPFRPRCTTSPSSSMRTPLRVYFAFIWRLFNSGFFPPFLFFFGRVWTLSSISLTFLPLRSSSPLPLPVGEKKNLMSSSPSPFLKSARAPLKKCFLKKLVSVFPVVFFHII